MKKNQKHKSLNKVRPELAKQWEKDPQIHLKDLTSHKKNKLSIYASTRTEDLILWGKEPDAKINIRK